MGVQEQFDELTNSAYPYLKFYSLSLNQDRSNIVVSIIYDCRVIQYKELETKRSEIAGYLMKVIKENYSFSISFIRGRFSKQDIVEAVLGYFNDASALIYSSLSKENVSVSLEHDSATITIKCNEAIIKHIEKKNYLAKLEEHLDNTGFIKHKVFVEPLKFDVVESNDNLERVRMTPKYKYEREGGRAINPTGRVKIGKYPISGNASYICDQNTEGDAVLYGKVTRLRQGSYVDKKDPSITHNYATFFLDDSTGTIRCDYFERKDTEGLSKYIEENRFIIAKGRVKHNSFANDGSLVFSIKSFNLCEECPFAINKYERIVSDRYFYVFPKEYSSRRQENLFEYTGSAAVINNVVLFDCVTASETGKEDAPLLMFNAVKIKNGSIVETFSSFVDPKITVNIKIRNILRVMPTDYLGKPTFDKVIPDFQLFSYGFKLTAIPYRENVNILEKLFNKLSIRHEPFVDLTNFIQSDEINEANKINRPLDRLISLAQAIEENKNNMIFNE